jgi:hypothetical protein
VGKLQRASLLPVCLLLLLSPFLAACGGGSGGGGRFTFKDFHTEAGGRVYLDDALVFGFSDPVSEASIGPDTIRIESGGKLARGTFVRGWVLLDPDSGTTIVIDPAQLSPDLIDRVEKSGRVDLVPRSVRYDLGASSAASGDRQVLLHRGGSFRKFVWFQPDFPTLPDLSDAGLVPGATYTIRIATGPNVPVVRSTSGERLSSRSGKPITESVTVVSLGAEHVFLGAECDGYARCVNVDPPDGAADVALDAKIRVRFNQPLDPRTVTTDNVRLAVSSISGSPETPITVRLRQSRLGTVEVEVTPLADLPPDQFFRLSLLGNIRDLAGSPLQSWDSSFGTASGGPTQDSWIVESFDDTQHRDAARTTADWSGTVPGALVGAPGADLQTEAVSTWFADPYCLTPVYHTPEADFFTAGGSVLFFAQGSRENVNTPGEPIDPDVDPARVNTTDWTPFEDIDLLDNFQYLRFRVVLRTAASWTPGDPVPTVEEIRIRVSKPGS